MPRSRFFTVDRLESATAVLIDEARRPIAVPRAILPQGLAEGVVLAVPLTPNGDPTWRHAVLDEAETARRRREAERTLEELKQRDPGGEIKL